MSIQLVNLLEQKKTTIVKKWFDLVVETYQPDTSQFLKSRKDAFANPVGNCISQNLGPLFDELISKMNYETTRSFLFPIIRVRAVQPTFSSSQAIAFVFSLKEIIRENLKKEIREKQVADDLLLFESKIDGLGLIAFDIFMECREKVYSIKANEERKRTFSAFERAGLITEIPANRPSLS